MIALAGTCVGGGGHRHRRIRHVVARPVAGVGVMRLRVFTPPMSCLAAAICVSPAGAQLRYHAALTVAATVLCVADHFRRCLGSEVVTVTWRSDELVDVHRLARLTALLMRWRPIQATPTAPGTIANRVRCGTRPAGSGLVALVSAHVCRYRPADRAASDLRRSCVRRPLFTVAGQRRWSGGYLLDG